MKKHIAMLICLLGIAFTAVSQDDRQWEFLVSAVSFEQQDGLIFKGNVGVQLFNAVIVSAPIGLDNYLRFQARRIDWTTSVTTRFGMEESEQIGFAAGVGFEHRWSPTKQFGIGVGVDAMFQKTEIDGSFASETDPFDLVINHTKKNFSIAPFLGLNYHITNWLMVRLETSVMIGVTHSINHGDIDITPVDVYTDASLRPLSVLGIAVRI